MYVSFDFREQLKDPFIAYKNMDIHENLNFYLLQARSAKENALRLDLVKSTTKKVNREVRLTIIHFLEPLRKKKVTRQNPTPDISSLIQKIYVEVLLATTEPIYIVVDINLSKS